jgi:hypothetical protein
MSLFTQYVSEQRTNKNCKEDEIKYQGTRRTLKPFTTYRLPLKPRHRSHMVVLALGTRGVVSAGKGVLQGTVIDCGEGTWALGPQKAGAQESLSRAGVLVSMAVRGGKERQVSEPSFRHQPHQSRRCRGYHRHRRSPEPYCPRAFWLVAGPDLLRGLAITFPLTRGVLLVRPVGCSSARAPG